MVRGIARRGRRWLGVGTIGAAGLVSALLAQGGAAPLAAATISPDQAKNILEVRVYRITPGRMDDFVNWMEKVTRWQESVGMEIPGQFAAPAQNRYVWIRQYPDEAVRKKRFAAVYGSGGMKQFGPPPGYEGGDVYLATATTSSMLQSTGMPPKAMPAGASATAGGPAIYEFRIYQLKPDAGDGFAAYMSDKMIPWQKSAYKVNVFAQLVPYAKVEGSANGGKVTSEGQTYIWGRVFANENEQAEKYKMYQDPAFRSVGSPADAGFDKVNIIILANPTSFSKLQ